MGGCLGRTSVNVLTSLQLLRRCMNSPWKKYSGRDALKAELQPASTTVLGQLRPTELPVCLGLPRPTFRKGWIGVPPRLQDIGAGLGLSRTPVQAAPLNLLNRTPEDWAVRKDASRLPPYQAEFAKAEFSGCDSSRSCSPSASCCPKTQAEGTVSKRAQLPYNSKGTRLSRLAKRRGSSTSPPPEREFW